MSKNLKQSQNATELFSQSFDLPASYFPLSQKLRSLRVQSKNIAIVFENFKQQVLCDFNKAIGRISSLIQREMTANHQLRQQLDVVKYSNQNMKKQVVQLREMIQQFVKSYNTQIQAKDLQIRELKTQLGMAVQQRISHSFLGNQPEQKRNSLQVIQQVSEYTGSCIQSIREISIPNSAKGSIIPLNENLSNLTQTHQDSWAEEDSKTNKSKTFLNFFRKNVDESVLVFQEKQKEGQSCCNSIDDFQLGQTDKINIPKTIQSPKNMQLLKKSAKKFSIQAQKENIALSELKTPHRRNNSNLSEPDQKGKSECKSQKNSRSHSKAGSKQKIKVTSKILDQSANYCSKNSKKPLVTLRPSVHLGGKMYLKKIIKQVRQALQQFKIWEGTRSRQVKYEGQKKNGMRWGKGKLLYDNGFQYSGTFVQNYKHGVGTISLNGMIFYQGQWSLDEVCGQGYIKSLKNYSQNCPKFLSQASFCGQLLENKLHGMGTLFLNQNQKIVTKFVHGVPVGDLTYYNHSQIQFGTWY